MRVRCKCGAQIDARAGPGPVKCMACGERFEVYPNLAQEVKHVVPQGAFGPSAFTPGKSSWQGPAAHAAPPSTTSAPPAPASAAFVYEWIPPNAPPPDEHARAMENVDWSRTIATVVLVIGLLGAGGLLIRSCQTMTQKERGYWNEREKDELNFSALLSFGAGVGLAVGALLQWTLLQSLLSGVVIVTEMSKTLTKMELAQRALPPQK